MIREGRARGVVRILSAAKELGFGLKELFGRDAAEALSRECCRMLRCGEVEDAVDLMETLAGNSEMLNAAQHKLSKFNVFGFIPL